MKVLRQDFVATHDVRVVQSLIFVLEAASSITT